MQIVKVGDDSSLGRWTYSSWRPPQLEGSVDHLWHFDGPSSHRRKRILPNGMVELLVNFGEPYLLLGGKPPERMANAALSSAQPGPLMLEQPARQDVLGVRLRPAGAYALLACPMREVIGLHLDLRDVVGPAANELIEQCHDAGTVAERFRIAAAWLADRVARARGVDPQVAWSAARIERSGGAVSIAELREQTGFSKRRLAASFREQIGLTPKRYARIVRFRRALAMLQHGMQPLVDVALAAGYYDQSHMIAEFRELGGLTPREFVAARHPVGDGSSATEPSSRLG